MKLSHAIVAVLGSALTLGGVGINQHFYHTIKHTGPVYVIGHVNNLGYVLQRANSEAFLMKFDEDVQLNNGTILKDIAYTDVSRTVRHLESATPNK